MTCKCDFATGECQAPTGCKAIAEIERLRLFLNEIAAMGPADEEWDADTLASATALAKRALERTPQAFIEAKAERDAGWPRDFEQEADDTPSRPGQPSR